MYEAQHDSGKLTSKFEFSVEEEHHNPNQYDCKCSSNQYTCELDNRQEEKCGHVRSHDCVAAHKTLKLQLQ